MSLDDLMEVWRSQDAAPLHAVNETLLRLALRQDEAKLRTTRRREMWFVYISMALLVGFMAFIVWVMIYPNDDDVLSGWDYAVAVVGLAAALIMWGAVYIRYRAQALREQGFGESLRDQLNRQIALIDPWLIETWAERVGLAILALTAAAALAFIGARINEKPYDETWRPVVSAILAALIAGTLGRWWQRRWVRRDLLPRKRRLEALLKELDG